MMNGFIYVSFVVACMVLLGCAWLIAKSLDLAVSGSIEKLKNKSEEGTPGVGSEKNRWRIPGTRNRLGHFCGVSDESPITPVVVDDRWVEPPISKTKAGIHFPQGDPANPHDHTEMMRGPYPLPLTEKAAVDRSWEIWVRDHDQAIKHLEEQVEALESLTKVTGQHGTEIYTDIKPRIKNIETHIVVSDKQIAELDDKLADSIFILYGGKKPDGK
jgi:hypothetical protein